MSEATPSHWAQGYVHRATLVCPSCDGSGLVDSFVCGACVGAGKYSVICGGAAEMDLEHPALGAYCIAEQRVVPLEEVTYGASPNGNAD